MQITLISPRIALQKGDYLGSGIPYWPVELAILAAVLRQKGHDVSTLDLFGLAPSSLEDRGDHYLQGKPFSFFSQKQQVLGADIFAVYALSCMSHAETVSIVAELKKIKPAAPVLVLENSQAVTAYDIKKTAGDFLAIGGVCLVCGEIFWNSDEVLAFVLSGGKRPKPQNIIAAREDVASAKRLYNKTPSYPPPAWDLFPLENYWMLPYSHGPKKGKYLPLFASRGCVCECDFCVIPQTNDRVWRARAPEEVAKEILALRERFGVRHFQIEDVNPTLDRRQWDKICAILIEKNAGVFFYFASGTKSETITLQQVSVFAKAGCRYISISPETGSRRLLGEMGKTFDYEHGLNLVHECRKYGIATQACFLAGHPSETEEDHKMSCGYLRRLARAGLDEVAVFIVAPLAGSRLYNEDRIEMEKSAFVSFSPKGRAGWKTLAKRRSELISIFLTEKILRDPQIWWQGLKAVMGRPDTKMANLPRRMLFTCRILIGHHVTQFAKQLFNAGRREC